MTKAERQEKLKERLDVMLTHERRLWDSGRSYIAGVDEVGRGPLAGPVVAAAVILPRDFDVLGIDDSKKLSPKKREELFEVIKEKALAWAVGWVGPERIDEINILEATKEAMKQAVQGLSLPPDHVLIDGNFTVRALALPQTAIVKGDANSTSIAAASILAKVTRDRYMEEMDAVYPGYAFASNKGYGTKAHYDGLKAQGPTPIHRKTFISDYL
ncbi:MAG: ribonuclease HII [Firmicutes bacterium]|nr:ribonuclease HII [Bacillota bacterium]MBR3748698.1 ribonuclease HII [Bacillota bacterium]